MALSTDPLTLKETFLEENQIYSESGLNSESKPVGKLHEFDLLQDEIWLLQCPKGMDVTELQNQKLKIPGRTNINNSESFSVEYTSGREQHAFAYPNRKGKYDLRLLPVRGTIVVRDRLKAASVVTVESAEQFCPPSKKMPMPANIHKRHPLLGVYYKDKMKLDKTIVKRLQKADELSCGILKERLRNKNKRIVQWKFENKQESIVSLVETKSGVDNPVEFVTEEKHKKRKGKRKLIESSNKASNTVNPTGNNNKLKMSEELVPKDLQWIQNI